MPLDSAPASPSKAALWTGRILSAIPALFLLFGGVMNLFKPPFVVEGMTKYGFPESIVVPLGVAVIVSVVLYLVPRTAFVGAILLTAYLGGAVATHVRASEFPNIAPAIIVATMLWLGLALRDPRVRALVPLLS